MLQVVNDVRETLDYRLREIFKLAEEAREQQFWTLANTACEFLLRFALIEDTNERKIRLNIVVTDLYGDKFGQTKYTLVRLTYLDDRNYSTCFPISILTNDAQGQCYRRHMHEFQLRFEPQNARDGPVKILDENKRLILTARLQKLVGNRAAGDKPLLNIR